MYPTNIVSGISGAAFASVTLMIHFIHIYAHLAFYNITS